MTQEHLHNILDYNEETGIFVWRTTKQGRRGTLEAGHESKFFDYLQIMIDGKRYYAHKLAWLYTHGTTPKYLDHIDRNGKNNKISNLREATHSDNMKNRRKQKHNTSGHSGVTYRKDQDKWRVSIGHNGERINLGSFKDKDEAIAKRKEYEIKYGY